MQQQHLAGASEDALVRGMKLALENRQMDASV